MSTESRDHPRRSTRDSGEAATPLAHSRSTRRGRRQRAEALERWRAARDRVHERWDLVVVADRHSRPEAFAAYDAALDLEEAAADELAWLSGPAVAEAA